MVLNNSYHICFTCFKMGIFPSLTLTETSELNNIFYLTSYSFFCNILAISGFQLTLSNESKKVEMWNTACLSAETPKAFRVLDPGCKWLAPLT